MLFGLTQTEYFLKLFSLIDIAKEHAQLQHEN